MLFKEVEHNPGMGTSFVQDNFFICRLLHGQKVIFVKDVRHISFGIIRSCGN